MTTPSTQKSVLITGCSSGIGLELLRLYADAGYHVTATALPGSLPELLAHEVAQRENVTPEALDVVDYETASAIVERLKQRLGRIDILINNAGISYRSVVEDMTPEDEQRQLQVNYLGPMHLIRECLPMMRAQKSGHIVNVSSVGGMMAMPTMASYSASKFALEGASESLWYELKPWGIHVSLVRPGFINSLAFRKVLYSKKKEADASSPEYRNHYENMSRFVSKLMQGTPCTSEDVARRIYKLTHRKRPPLRTAGTPDASVFHYVRRLLPRPVYHWLLFRTLPGVKTWGKP